MEKTIEIPEGHEARIEGNKVILEPKESEDERIRKALIGHLKAGVDFVSNGVTKAECIAWLEKKKEQKPESCDCSRDEESYTNGIHHVLMNPEAYGLIKQKPAEWSEEDERTLESFLGWLQGSMGEKTYSSWLKSLPERFSLKPKQEWSEEDETMFKWISVRIQEHHMSLEYTKQVRNALAWLKSLRPQPHWKPSEEQISALENSTALNEEQGAHLYSLLCDLQKLL